MHILPQRKRTVKEEAPIVRPIPWEGHERAEYYCSTTKRYFEPVSLQYQVVCGRVFIWTYCPLCDSHCRTKGEPGYNAAWPQPHSFVLCDVPPDALADLTARLSEQQGMVCREAEHAL